MIMMDRVEPDDDPLLVWVAQDMKPGVRAWALGDAAAVARRDVGNRDRVAVRGSVADVAELLRRIRPEVADHYPVGDESLITAVAGIELVAGFGWMQTTAPAPASAAGTGEELTWLTDADAEVDAFLDVNHPHSFARPGKGGATRWACLRDDAGRLLAVATDAGSTTRIGFISGVATRLDARGRGLATRLCAALTDELLDGRDRVALLVDHDNIAAVRTYERLGYAMRRVAAAKFPG
ncbi:GNAT family N-acetyltransferase [Actinoplanes sp. NPDC051494]|uniref:GNAT family N-acetyltransferase n=1 Tax=Actinoplanes sp. NPDC051494 TaxID=3363907 RepID=UPI00378985B8